MSETNIEKIKLNENVTELMSGWNEEIPGINEKIKILANEYRISGFEGQNDVLESLLNTIQCLQESLIILKEVPDFMSTVKVQSWYENEKNMLKVIEDLLQAFEKKDLSLFADLLEYNLCASLMTWREIFLQGIQSASYIMDRELDIKK